RLSTKPATRPTCALTPLTTELSATTLSTRGSIVEDSTVSYAKMGDGSKSSGSSAPCLESKVYGDCLLKLVIGSFVLLFINGSLIKGRPSRGCCLLGVVR